MSIVGFVLADGTPMLQPVAVLASHRLGQEFQTREAGWRRRVRSGYRQTSKWEASSDPWSRPRLYKHGLPFRIGERDDHLPTAFLWPAARHSDPASLQLLSRVHEDGNDVWMQRSHLSGPGCCCGQSLTAAAGWLRELCVQGFEALGVYRGREPPLSGTAAGSRTLERPSSQTKRLA